MEDIVRQRFKEILQAKGLTINKVASSCNIPQSNVQKQLAGDTTISLKTILAILNGLPYISSEWLLRGNGDMFLDSASAETKAHNKSLIDRIMDMVSSCGDEQYYENQLEEKDKTIRTLLKKLNTLETTVNALNKEIQSFEKDVNDEIVRRQRQEDNKL